MSTKYKLLQEIYNRTVRPYLPKTWAVYSGVTVRNARLFDLEACDPDYKLGLIEAIREHSESRNVELVGLGRGVSTVHAIQAGATHVTAYEASKSMIDEARTTLDVNWCDRSRLTIRHALVGEDVNVFGAVGEADQMFPSELNTADMLVLDVEGAELGILDSISTWPEIVIVETHPVLGAPTTEVLDRLEPVYADVEAREHKPGAPPEKQVVVASGKSVSGE